MEEKKKESIIASIISKTIGFDLAPTSPMPSYEEDNKDIYFDSSNKSESKPYELPEYYKGLVDYTPTESERDVICMLIKHERIDGYDIEKNAAGQLIVSTPQSTWMSLYGRKWLVDLEELTVRLIAMS